MTEGLMQETADLIAPFNQALAELWLEQPFRRGYLAIAFRAGFVEPTGHELHLCDLVDRAANLDRRARELGCAE